MGLNAPRAGDTTAADSRWHGEALTLVLLAAAVPVGAVLVAAIFAALSLVGFEMLPVGPALLLGAVLMLIPASRAAWSLRHERAPQGRHRALASGTSGSSGALTRRQEWASMGALFGGMAVGYAVCLPAAAWLDDHGRSTDLITGLLLAGPVAIGVGVQAVYRRRLHQAAAGTPR